MSWEARLLRRLPPTWRRPLHRMLWLPVDLIEAATGRRPALQPPRGLSYVGAGDGVAIGGEFLGYFRDLAGLSPSDRVLDVGCGIGRMAVPLTAYLADGTYDGFDISAADIRWCRGNISRSYPTFRFHHADVINREYNPKGRISAADFAFPFSEDAFDFSFATSVFTHFLTPALERYLDELARVLRSGGVLCATFFLVDEEARRSIAEGRTELRFEHSHGAAWVHDKDNPEGAVAYSWETVEQLFARRGFEVTARHPGTWSGRGGGVSYQDLVIARWTRDG
ncbi:MAG: class I SAM-dependent methyltransferase [Acidobacteriota bacterium]